MKCCIFVNQELNTCLADSQSKFGQKLVFTGNLAFGQSTGNIVSGHYVWHHFPSPPPIFFLHTLRFSYKECLDQKTYFAKVYRNTQKSRGKHLSRPRWPFWGPLAAILDFIGGGVLQAVSKCPQVTRMELKLSWNWLWPSRIVAKPNGKKCGYQSFDHYWGWKERKESLNYVGTCSSTY